MQKLLKELEFGYYERIVAGNKFRFQHVYESLNMFIYNIFIKCPFKDAEESCPGKYG
jgi:hypothetical protein